MLFGGGPLVEALDMVLGAGGSHVYFCRVSEQPSLLPEEYLAALVASFELLLDWPVELLLPVGVSFDSASPDFLPSCLDFVKAKAVMGEEPHLILGVNVFAGQDVTVWRDALLARSQAVSFLQEVGDLGEPVFWGRNFSVVAAQTAFGGAVRNCAPTYAGLLTRLPCAVSPVNKDTFLYNLDSPFGPEGRQALADAGYVTFASTVRHGISPQYAVTMAPPESDYHYVQNERLVIEALSRIRSAVEPYVGRPGFIEGPVRQALEDMIGDSIRDYRLWIEYRRGLAEIDLVLVPIFDVRELQINTSLVVPLV